jgi:hypothetical protein
VLKSDILLKGSISERFYAIESDSFQGGTVFNDFADGYICQLIAPAEVNLSQVVAIGGKLQHRTVC